MREIVSLLVAPTIRSTSFPSLKRIRVGIPLIPNRWAIDGLSSTLSFTTSALLKYCSPTASTVDANILQGAHHSAQKSTKTGFSDCKTSFSKELSLTILTFSLIIVTPVSLLFSILCSSTSVFDEVLKQTYTRRMSKLPKCLGFYLSNSLACDVEVLPHLFQGALMALMVQPKPHA